MPNDASASRPAVTKAQIIAAIGAGVPILINLLAAFGVFVPGPAEQHALTVATEWASGFALLLVGADAGLRSARNQADGKAKLAAAIHEHSVALMRPSQPPAFRGEPLANFGTLKAEAGESTPLGSNLGDLPPDAADHDGPGDLFDPLPHVPVMDPARLKPDAVDQEDPETKTSLAALARTAHHKTRLESYRLTEHERAVARPLLLQYMNWALTHQAEVHYTQDAAARWSAIHENLLIKHGGKLTRGDCSSTSTWLLRNVAYLFGFHEDVFNGAHYLGGYTGTLINHGRVVHHDANLRFGDLIFYGNQGGGVPEHVAMYIGGGMVFSHGGDDGPFKLTLDYRSDRVAARRYF